jgi:hypothetical protein
MAKQFSVLSRSGRQGQVQAELNTAIRDLSRTVYADRDNSDFKVGPVSVSLYGDGVALAVTCSWDDGN